ncbi:MAG TPA: hypothetical protein ENL03_03680, partial [Phycisphaerae bacterium]|nr:hypothetical protein [Phycisphaerae bacterium]
RHESRFDHPVSDEFDMSLKGPLAGQLVDLADEIAYTSADLDDSLAAGLLDPEQLSGLDLWRLSLDAAERNAPEARAIHKRIRACKILLSSMADDVLFFAAANIQRMQIESSDDVRNAGEKIVSFSPEMARQVRQVQQFLYDNIYTSGPNAEKNRNSQQVIRDIFAAYIDDISLLPARYRSRIDSDGLHKTICDYIAGMTDRFCTAEHKRVMDML